MSIGLNKMIIELTEIHEYLLESQKLDDLDYVLSYLETYDYELREQYLRTLLRHYFHENRVENFKELFSLGYKFDLNMEDIKFAFLNISSKDENVIELLEDDVVFFKDVDYNNSLRAIYEYYQNVDEELKSNLEGTVNLLKKNNYICAYCYKNKSFSFAEFFLDEDLLAFLKEDLPFLLK